MAKIVETQAFPAQRLQERPQSMLAQQLARQQVMALHARFITGCIAAVDRPE